MERFEVETGKYIEGNRLANLTYAVQLKRKIDNVSNEVDSKVQNHRLSSDFHIHSL